MSAIGIESRSVSSPSFCEISACAPMITMPSTMKLASHSAMSLRWPRNAMTSAGTAANASGNTATLSSSSRRDTSSKPSEPLTSMPVALTAWVEVWSDSQPNGSPTISALNRIHSARA